MTQTWAVGDVCRVRGVRGVFVIKEMAIVRDEVRLWGGVKNKRMFRYVTLDRLMPARKDDVAPKQWGEQR